MADNVGYTPGTGATIAADEIGGALYQRIKLTTGADGTATDVSPANPLPIEVQNFPTPTGLTDAQLRAAPVPVDATGELIEAIESLRMSVQSLTRTVGLVQPDSAARMRVVVDAITGSLTLATVTTVGTVTTVTTLGTVTTLTNQTQIGGNFANDQVPALMRMAADSARRNISTS